MTSSELDSPDPLVQLGIEGCRLGDWDIGLPALLSAITRTPPDTALPSLVYSYVGCGLALVEGQIGGGVEACEWAARPQAERTPEHVVNLVRALLAGQLQGRAYAVLEGALHEHPDHQELVFLRNSLGMRQPSAIPSLSRGNILNRLLGRIRKPTTKSNADPISPALESVLSDGPLHSS